MLCFQSFLCAKHVFFFLNEGYFYSRSFQKYSRPFVENSKTFQGYPTIFQFSRTFQVHDAFSRTFEACANHELGGPGTPAKLFERPKGSLKILFGRPSRSFRLNCFPEIFLSVQPCSPLVIGSNNTLHAIVECGSAFLRKLVKRMQI